MLCCRCLNQLLVYCVSHRNTFKVSGDLCNLQCLSLLCVLQLPISSKIAHILMYHLWTENWTWCLMRCYLNIQNTFYVIHIFPHTYTPQHRHKQTQTSTHNVYFSILSSEKVSLHFWISLRIQVCALLLYELNIPIIRMK